MLQGVLIETGICVVIFGIVCIVDMVRNNDKVETHTVGKWTITDNVLPQHANAFVITDPHGQKFLLVRDTVIPYKEPVSSIVEESK